MNKILLSLFLLFMGVTTMVAQIECTNNPTVILDANGEALLPVTDIVDNIEFMLTQGEVTYYVYPFTTGVITSASDVIAIDCDSRGLPNFLIEVTDGTDLIDNCSGQMVITSPNGGCPGDNPSFCDENDLECSKAIDYFGYGGGSSDYDIFAIDIAQCSDAAGCIGSYGIAFGSIADAASLTYTTSISTEDTDQFENPVVLSYTENGVTDYDQSVVVIWENVPCVLISSFQPTLGLDNSGNLTIAASDFLDGEEVCDNIELAITSVSADLPGTYASTIDIDCDHIGPQKIWLRDTETQYVVTREVQILDPTEACGTFLGDGDRLISTTKSISGLFFNTDIQVNGTVLPRHPGGIGWVLNEDDLIEGSNTLQFVFDEFSLNGISTLDLVLGLRIILLDDYDHPRESVLFDMDESGYNGIGDLILSREIILGINNGQTLPDAFFFNNSYIFPSDFDPFDFDNTFTTFTFDKADFDDVDLTFEAYKVGDLNETAVPGIKDNEDDHAEARGEAPSYQVSDLALQAGQQFQFTLKYESEENFKGLLAALIGDGIEFLDLTSETPGVQFNINQPNEIRISYLNAAAEAQINTIEFEITAYADKAGNLVDLLGLKSGFPQEVVDGDNNTIVIDDIIEIIILSNDDLEGLSTISVYPNPTAGMLRVESSSLDMSSAKVYDSMGRLLLCQSLSGTSDNMDVRSLTSGLYFMTVQSADGISQKSFWKM